MKEKVRPMQTEKPGAATVIHRHADGRTMPAHWCIESDTTHNVIARRNALMALWAGRQLGLQGAEMAPYARSVHFSDYQVDGDADIVCKVRSDLAEHGVEIDDADVRRKLWEFHKEALRQSSATD